MTHLRIEQNNGTIEEVSSAVIDKLYDIVSSGNLDQNSNLIGRLHTTATYQDYIDYLEDAFKVNGTKLLIIDATKKYIMFADHEVASYWANSTYGDGTGIDITSAASVLNIPNEAFKNNTSILTFDELSRYFPNCTTINYYAFYGASNLRSIDLSNITTLGENAFNSCAITGTLNLPKLTSVSERCLSYSQLTEINIGSDVNDSNRITTIPHIMFLESPQLTKVTGLNKVTTIGEGAFNKCSSLTQIDTSSELTSVGLKAFLNAKLLCIDLSNVTTIGGASAFESNNLVDLSTSDPTLINTGVATYTFNWSTIPDYTFYKCPLNNKSFIFPNATSIGQRVFYQSSLVAFSGPNITTMGSSFDECTLLTSINLPNVTIIGNNAFTRCISLTSINLSNVTSIGSRAFYNCTSLGTNEILELNLTAQDVNPEEFLANTKYKGLILHWPNSIPNGWRSNYPLWSYMALLEYLDISDTKWGVDHRGNNSRALAFYGNTNIKTVILSPDYNYIWSSKSIFYLHSGFLHLIILNDSVIGIESSDNDKFFEANYAPQLNIYVPDSLLSSYLADATWSQISNISSHLKGLSELLAGVWTTGLAVSKYKLLFSDSEFSKYMISHYALDGILLTNSDIAAVTSLPNLAFYNNTDIISANDLLYFTNLITIPQYCFCNCTNLTSVNLNNISSIEQKSFMGCTGLISITINSSILTTIGDDAFSGCTNLVIDNLSLPNLTSLGSTVFEGVKILLISNLGSVITQLPNLCFNKNPQLTSINIPSQVTTIGDYCFRLCTGLTSIDLSHIITIKRYAFQDCTNLTTLNLNTNNPPDIHEAAFQGCSSLLSIDLSNSSYSTVENNTFEGCTSLLSVSLSSNIKKIKSDVFSGCSLLSTINLSNITEILMRSFKDCTSLISVDLSSCTTIYNNVFMGCTSLLTVTLGSSITLGASAFENCQSLASIDLTYVTSLGNGALAGCTSLINMDLRNCTSLGSFVFWGDTNVKTINLSGVTFNGNILLMFYNCSSLEKLTLGTMNNIGSNAFSYNRNPLYGCNSLKVLDINQLNQLDFTVNVFITSSVCEAFIIRNTTTIPTITVSNNGLISFANLTSSSNLKIYVDDNLYSTYINDSNWSNLANYIDVISNYNPS